MKISKLLALLLILLGLSVRSQVNDAGLWVSGSVSVRVSKKIEISAAPEFRLNENFSQIQSVFTDLGGQYKITKQFFVNYTHRIGTRSNDGFYEMRNRSQLGLGYKFEIQDFDLVLQTRYQALINNAGAENDPDLKSTLRSKVQVKYNGIKKFQFTGSYEVFHNANLYGEMSWENWRAAVQMERKYKKINFFTLGYLIQRDLTTKAPEMDFVITMGYKRELDWRKNKKDEMPKSDPTAIPKSE